MAPSNRPREFDPGSQRSGYPGEDLGLPESGPGSIVGMGRRLLALLIDWFIAYGLAGLTVSFGLVTSKQFVFGNTGATIVLLVWLALGVFAVRFFGFTPGQFACGLRVASVDRRVHVGIGRALGRGLLIVPMVPALFVDTDGRGIQDRITSTAVVRR